AEHEPESGPRRAESGCRRHREVELERVWQQEHPVGGRPALQIDDWHRVELVEQEACPVIEHVSDANIVGDTEGEVHVGEAIAAVNGERANDGSGHDALILVPEPQHSLAETIPLLNVEHEARY